MKNLISKLLGYGVYLYRHHRYRRSLTVLLCFWGVTGGYAMLFSGVDGVIYSLLAGLLGPISLILGRLLGVSATTAVGLSILLVVLITAGRSLYRAIWQKRPEEGLESKQEANRRQQKRLTPLEARERLGLSADQPALPLAESHQPDGITTLGLPLPRARETHTLVIAPTRAGKGVMATDVLLRYPHAMIVIDPKGELYERTAGVREQWGPIYSLPDVSVDLADYYDLGRRDDVTELHRHWMKPWRHENPIFANLCKPLFEAAYRYAQAHRLNPIRVLLDASVTDAVTVLSSFATICPDLIRTFTAGDDPEKGLNRTTQSAWATFTTELFDYYDHRHTLTNAALPADWVAQGGTLYITYPMETLAGAGGAISSIIAGLVRAQMRQSEPRSPLLCLIDEMPVIGLGNIGEYLATTAGYNLTFLLYAQSKSQLTTVYGKERANTILGNCRTQLWYAPMETETAEMMSELYGTEYDLTYSVSRSERPVFLGTLPSRQANINTQTDKRPALSPAAMRALDRDKVLLVVDDAVTIAHRLWGVGRFSSLPRPSYCRQGTGSSSAEQITPWVVPMKKGAQEEKRRPI